MPDKLIDGNITIEDKASRGLGVINKELINLDKTAKRSLQSVIKLNTELIKIDKHRRKRGLSTEYSPADYNLVKAPSNFKHYSSSNSLNRKKFEVLDTGVHYSSNGRKLTSIDARYYNRGLRGEDPRLLIGSFKEHDPVIPVKYQRTKERVSNLRARLNPSVSASSILMKGAHWYGDLAYRAIPQRQMHPFLDPSRSPALRFGSGIVNAYNPLNAMENGLQVVDVFANKLSKVFTPKLKASVTEGVRGAISGASGNAKIPGGALSGTIGGRFLGGMFGRPVLGSMVGGFLGGGLAGLGIGVAISGIIAGIGKLTDYVGDILETVKTIASERAAESTSLRRKMQMSSEMFGVNPEDINEIDTKIYGLRERERQMYLHGMPGRDITSSAIEWLHLLGTKETGGTFANEQQAFDFSQALATIAKMNGLSPQEYETVRYQGMQILSKGYADILDVKPLLNSAPGFVRDLLAQTGMSRSEFLESGRTRAFTSDKFIDALMNVKDYYEVLSDRATSRTTEQQEEAAKNIIGAASIWDEMYEKTKAESNTRVANAIIEGGIIGHIRESWYKMWSDTNDAQDGITKKVEFEKKVTSDILKGVLGVYVIGVRLKNLVDKVYNHAKLLVNLVLDVVLGIVDVLSSGVSSLLALVFRTVANAPGTDREYWEAQAAAVDPNSKERLEQRAKEDYSKRLAREAASVNVKGGEAASIAALGALVSDEKIVGRERVVVEQKVPREVIEVAENAPGSLYPGYTPSGVNPSNVRPAARVKKTIYDTFTHTVMRPIMENVVNEELAKSILYSGANANRTTKTIADESSIRENIESNFNRALDASGNIKGAKALGLPGNVSDYTWQSMMGRRFTNDIKEFVKNQQQDTDDVKSAEELQRKLLNEIEQALQNVKGPYIPKTAKDVEDLKNGKGRGASEILDVLKEIAGVVVINKVTKVRPDVVFNYGSYGRNGSNEDPNLLRTGDARASLVNELNNAMAAAMAYLDDDRIESDIGGVIVLDSAAV